MPFKKPGFNTSSIYVKHVLFNGCILYYPVEDETKVEATKAYLKSFNSWQMHQFAPGPEYA